ncbi:MAG: signal peptidase I [Ruminococcaceae bacterium]|nr:signal peptidase I [Oscillospiraceae bacterium]
MEQKQRERNTAVLEWFDALIFALAIVLVVLLFIVRTVNVDGLSMVPTLDNGEQLLIRSIAYTPQHGDVVVVDGYTNYGAPLVKRVIGLEGDVIDIDFETGDVFVNDQLLDEPYINDLTRRQYDIEFPVVVPEGKVFLMGDNRMYSIDSRHSEIGYIDERDILGEVILRIFPINKFGLIS